MKESFAALLRTAAGKLALSLLVASQTTAYTFKQVPSPNLNLDDLGRIAFTGDFDSISLYQYEGQSQQYPGRNGALLARYPNGVFATINVTDADIKAMCSLQVNGAERVVFAGNFTGVGDMPTPGGIALLDPANGNVQAVEGLSGSINALYCDRDGGQVYVGGSLSGVNSTNALVWKNGWQPLSFNGFNGPVHSITRASNNNIIFGGEFNGLGGNASIVSSENNTQTIPISNADISAQTSSGLDGLSDPKTIACKPDFTTQGPGSTWLLADRSPGFWRANFGFGFEPTSLRLFNTDFQGRGSKTFRFTALPDGGILNLTYTDPTTGQKAFCDATCPLPEGNTTAQDFTFVNVVGMNAFRLDISDWWGAGAGLNGIQLFQDGEWPCSTHFQFVMLTLPRQLCTPMQLTTSMNLRTVALPPQGQHRPRLALGKLHHHTRASLSTSRQSSRAIPSTPLRQAPLSSLTSGSLAITRLPSTLLDARVMAPVVPAAE